MSYGLYDYDRRYRRRFWTRLAKILVWLAVLTVVGAFSYQLGVEQLKNRELALREDIVRLTAERDQLEARAAQLQTIAQTAEIRANELQVRYQREVPTGDLGLLMEHVAKRLAEGVDPSRLAFVIDRTGNPRACEKPDAKRFVLPTPIYKGANTSVVFFDGAITVTGEGVSAMSPEGSPEAWFDPTKSVTVKFIQVGGETTEVKGVLPLQHSIVINDKEHRFTISPSARSFVDVSGVRCPFP